MIEWAGLPRVSAGLPPMPCTMRRAGTAHAIRAGGLAAGRPNDPLFLALIKTVGSMVLSIAIYSFSGGLAFAVGFVLLMLVHELGHVLAMRYYGLSASPPIFIPTWAP